MKPHTESRKSLLAKLHIAKKNLGLDDETYRAMLDRLTGHRSASECSDRQLVMVVASLRKLGWNPARDTSKSRAQGDKAPKVHPDHEPVLGKINALRLSTEKSWEYVESIAQRMYGVGVSWCTAVQLRGVVSALTKHQAAQAKKKAAQSAADHSSGSSSGSASGCAA